MKFPLITISGIALLSSAALAGPISWGLCQTACNAGYGVCCISAGAVAGESVRKNQDTLFIDSHNVIASALC
jgi:hypothetical protein